MNTEKKKPGKLKKTLTTIIAVLAILFIIGMFAEDEDAPPYIEEAAGIDEDSDLMPESEETEGKTQDKAEVPEPAEQEPPEPERISDTRLQIGDTVTLWMDNGGKINVTLTDWGSKYNGFDGTVLYVSYTIENVGKENVTVGPGLFDVYADD